MDFVGRNSSQCLPQARYQPTHSSEEEELPARFAPTLDIYSVVSHSNCGSSRYIDSSVSAPTCFTGVSQSYGILDVKHSASMYGNRSAFLSTLRSQSLSWQSN